MKYLCRDKKSLDKYFFIPEEDMEDYARRHDRLPVIYYKSGKTSGSLYEVNRDESDEIWAKYDNKEIIELALGHINNPHAQALMLIQDKINEIIVSINKEVM